MEKVYPRESIKIDLSYELAFIRNLAIWLAVGAILGLVLPTWLVFTGLIAWCYIDGKIKSKKGAANEHNS